ncbi:MAG: 6-bladed beta-propeller [Acidobacteriota bacterium]
MRISSMTLFPRGTAMAITAAALLGLASANPAVARGSPKTDPPAAGPELVWPLQPELPRVRYLQAYHGSRDFRKKPSRWRRFLLGHEEEASISLRKPYGVTTGSDGTVYVTDTGFGAVVVFDPEARQVRLLGGGGRAALHTPIGIAIDAQERIWVSDADLDHVFCFSPEGEVILAVGQGEGLTNPTGIAIDRERQRLYVADSHLHQIVLYSTADGAHIATLGSRGPGEGQFNFPTNVALDPEGNLYVVDTGNFRVQVFSPDGEFVSTFGEAGDGFGDFHRPKGIALDSEGHIYVADAAFNNVQIFDRQGQLLLFVGALGQKPGAFWLPAGVHIDEQDRIFVVDQVNARVQVFQYLTEAAARARSKINRKENRRAPSSGRTVSPDEKGGESNHDTQS